MMARQIENPYGMYPVVKIPVFQETEAERKQQSQALAAMFDLDTQLDYVVGLIEPLVEKSNPEACQIAGMIDDLPAYLATGNIRRAVLEGFKIGSLTERLYARQFEKKVVQVNSTTRKLREGAAQQAHSPDEIEKAIRLYKKILSRRPTPKKATAESEVLRRTGIPPRTLRPPLGKEMTLPKSLATF